MLNILWVKIVDLTCSFALIIPIVKILAARLPTGACAMGDLSKFT